jgi:hypothetical protein
MRYRDLPPGPDSGQIVVHVVALPAEPRNAP